MVTGCKIKNSVPRTILCLLVLLQIGFASIALADAEKFIGRIDKIEKKQVSITVTDPRFSEYAVGDQLNLLIDHNTRVLGKNRKLTTRAILAAGQLVKIQPHPRSDGQIGTDMFIILGREEQ